MASMKIKKGDMVKVIAGRDKDKEGKVIAVNKKDNTLLVEGVNMVSKHQKVNQKNPQGGIIRKDFDPACQCRTYEYIGSIGSRCCVSWK